ncbi:hypothetical protein N7499_008755 [Penicillium canescens]|nr:hypothetical protein N7499_008755 [Penicillium canescens]
MLRHVFLILACVAWIEFAIHFSPYFEEISHRFSVTKFSMAHDTVPVPPQNEEEHSRLLRSLQRSSGKWDSSHPRYRLLTALHGFTQHENSTQSELNRWRYLYKKAPKHQRRLLDSAINYTDKLKRTESLLKINARIARSIAHTGLQFYNITSTELDEFIRETEAQGRRADRTSVSQSMKHFVRDWADEGLRRTSGVFSVYLEITFHRLGRLAHEIQKLGGFEVVMNEWSAYMNLAYRYLSSRSKLDSVSFYPFADWWSHHATTADLERPVTFPNQLSDPSVVLIEGDFTTTFAEHTGQYDIIVTLFFIDTARNLISYIENIHRLLRPGGRWINLGPLMYGTAPFVQLSLNEIVTLCTRIGFDFQETNDRVGNITIPDLPVRGFEVAYGQNPRGLNKNAFQAQYWEAVKR